MALRLDYYATRFMLDANQRKKIENLVDEYTGKARPHMQAIFSAGSANAQATLIDLALEWDTRILAILTEEQRLQWKQQLGLSFDWKRLEEN